MKEIEVPITSRAVDAPRDLHSLQYAAWLCENTLAIPANKSNLEVIAAAIEAISTAKFADKKRRVFTAFLWLERQCRFAKIAKIPTNHLFFMNGVYNEIEEPEKKFPDFEPCPNCAFGWIDVVKDGKKIGVGMCECRKKWIADAKAM